MASENSPSSGAAAVLASLETIASSLSATQEALTDCLDLSVARRNASHRDPSLPHPALRAVSEVVLLLELNRERLIEAVKTIPAKAEYAPFAARLRQVAMGHAAVERLLDEAPRVAAPLADTVPTLMQIADELLAGRDRLLEAGRGLRTSLSLAAKPLDAPPATAAVAVPPTSLGPEAESLGVSLRAVAEIAGPLVDSLTDISHLVTPLVEKLRQANAPAPKPEPRPQAVAPRDGLAQWSADILKAVRDLKEAAQHAPRPTGDEERRLWENVRQLQTEIVNLQGTLLSPPKPL